ncbi:MAG TPA: hypothetical protein VJZ71_07865 [Phycisphaerae bacterium]|nr:hypothetical protein [Phycisphaerae bacterium]
MWNGSRVKTLARISLAVFFVPLCIAATCPNTGNTCPAGSGQVLVNGVCQCPAGQTLVNGVCTAATTQVTLRSETLTGANAVAPALTGQCGTGGVNTTNISNGTAGKQLHATVTCATAQSRPQIFITDGTTIIAQSSAVGIPGPSASTDGFPPASNNFQVRVRECAPNAAGRLYTITVTQDQ